MYFECDSLAKKDEWKDEKSRMNLIALLFYFQNFYRYSDNIVTVNYFGHDINVLEIWYHDSPIWNNVNQWIIHNNIRNVLWK